MKILGVDIGTYEVKTVLMEVGLVTKQVTAASYYPIGNNDPKDVVAEATAGTFDLVALSVNRLYVANRSITVPFKGREVLDRVVPGEAEEVLPFTLAQGYVDYYIVDDTKASATELIVFGLSHDDYEKQQTLYAASNRADAFHQVDTYAAVNALLELNAVGPETIAVIDVGHNKMAIEILSNRKLVFTRCVEMGGEMMTKAIAEQRGAPMEEAEALKLAAFSGTSEGSQEDRDTAMKAANRLLGEIKFTFKSYEAAPGAKPVQGVVLVGGTAKAAGFAEALSQKLNLPVRRPKPEGPAAMPQELAADLPRFAGAYGMALFGRDATALLGKPQSEITADFLREGRAIWKYHRQRISRAVTGVLVLALAYVLVQVGQIRRLRDQSQELARSIETALDGVNKANESKGRKKITLAQLDLALRDANRRLSLLRRPPVSNLGILNEVSRLVPAGTRFVVRNFSIETGLVTITAEAASNEEADRITAGIQASKAFKDVRKVEASNSPENPSRVQFKVQFKVGE